MGLRVHRSLVIGASSGNSAALLIYAGKNNELTFDQRKNPPIGSGVAVAVPFAVAVQEPWRLLVMSDGVSKYAGRDRFQGDFTLVVFKAPHNSGNTADHGCD